MIVLVVGNVRKTAMMYGKTTPIPCRATLPMPAKQKAPRIRRRSILDSY